MQYDVLGVSWLLWAFLKKKSELPRIKTSKYLSLMALMDLGWMTEFFYLTVTCDVEKTSYLLFKVFEQFY